MKTHDSSRFRGLRAMLLFKILLNPVDRTSPADTVACLASNNILDLDFLSDVSKFDSSSFQPQSNPRGKGKEGYGPFSPLGILETQEGILARRDSSG